MSTGINADPEFELASGSSMRLEIYLNTPAVGFLEQSIVRSISGYRKRLSLVQDQQSQRTT
jgi:hypothetical protein